MRSLDVGAKLRLFRQARSANDMSRRAWSKPEPRVPLRTAQSDALPVPAKGKTDGCRKLLTQFAPEPFISGARAARTAEPPRRYATGRLPVSAAGAGALAYPLRHGVGPGDARARESRRGRSSPPDAVGPDDRIQ